jgi:hypothetical protein
VKIISTIEPVSAKTLILVSRLPDGEGISRKLSDLQLPEGSRSVDWKSTLIPVIPAEAGIQAVFEREPRTNLDAGLAGMTSPEGEISTIPERDIKIFPGGSFTSDNASKQNRSFQFPAQSMV